MRTLDEVLKSIPTAGGDVMKSEDVTRIMTAYFAELQAEKDSGSSFKGWFTKAKDAVTEAAEDVREVAADKLNDALEVASDVKDAAASKVKTVREAASDLIKPKAEMQFMDFVKIVRTSDPGLDGRTGWISGVAVEYPGCTFYIISLNDIIEYTSSMGTHIKANSIMLIEHCLEKC